MRELNFGGEFYFSQFVILEREILMEDVGIVITFKELLELDVAKIVVDIMA